MGKKIKAYPVGREALREMLAPSATETWQPIPHGLLFDLVTDRLGARGYSIASEKHTVTLNKDRYFGVLELKHASDTPGMDYGFAMGLRNANDKALPAGICAGSKVFVCDNLAFSGEAVIARKHTPNILRDLPGLIDGALDKLTVFRNAQDRRIAAYRGAEVSHMQAHDFVVRSLDEGVIAAQALPKVLAEWRTPRHAEFSSRTGWSLFNAYTEVMKESNIFTRPRATVQLHRMMDTLCGVN